MKPQANIRLDKELLQWLKDQAKKEDRSFNNYVSIILKNFKKKMENKNNEK